jgi:hypothetical protein
MDGTEKNGWVDVQAMYRWTQQQLLTFRRLWATSNPSSSSSIWREADTPQWCHRV